MEKLIDIIRDKKKRELLILLEKESLGVSELVAKSLMSQPQVSMILKEMRNIQIVDVEKIGKRRIYKINREKISLLIKELYDFLSRFDENEMNEIIVRR